MTDSGSKVSKGFLSFLYKPEEDINYTFILSAYGVCTLLSAVLYFVEKFLLVDAVRGYWIVFAPFVVMLPWAFVMRLRAASTFADSKKTKSD